MAFQVSDYISQIQALVQDAPLSKTVRVDDLTAQVDGVRSQFVLSNQNIVPVSYTGAILEASVDGAPFAAATLNDPVNGLATTATVPKSSVRFIYNFQLFACLDPTNPPYALQSVMYNGLRQIGVDPTNASAVANVAPTLFQVPCYIAAAEFLRENTQLVAKYYNFTIAGKNIQKGDVFKNIQAQAKAYDENARTIRDDFYKEQSRYLKPTIGISSTAYPNLYNSPRT